METKFEALKISVYNTISSRATKSKPIKARDLCLEFNISFRELKKIITSLREEVPIVSKETDGGGYWIAENEDDILNFIHMIERRKDGYENTLKAMNDFLANYGNIPYVD